MTMTPTKKLLGLLILLVAAGAFGQQEVVLKISEGMPMIPLALPDFIVRGSSPSVQGAAQEIRQALSDDVKYSRIFQLLPKEYYAYIRPLDPDKILFKDWDSIQARLLLTGEVREDGGRFVVTSLRSDLVVANGNLLEMSPAALVVRRGWPPK